MTLLKKILGRELSKKEIQLCKGGHISISRNLLFQKVETQYRMNGDNPQIELSVLVRRSTPDASYPRIMHYNESSRFFRRRVYDQDGKLMREYIIGGGVPGSGQQYSFNRFYIPPGKLIGKIVSIPGVFGEITEL